MRFFPLPQIMEGMSTYGALAGDYQFVISSDHTNGEFRGSWKHKNALNHGAVYLDGNPFKTYQECESACRHTFKALSNKN